MTRTQALVLGVIVWALVMWWIHVSFIETHQPWIKRRDRWWWIP
jgi:hypothetical protein